MGAVALPFWESLCGAALAAERDLTLGPTCACRKNVCLAGTGAVRPVRLGEQAVLLARGRSGLQALAAQAQARFAGS